MLKSVQVISHDLLFFLCFAVWVKLRGNALNAGYGIAGLRDET